MDFLGRLWGQEDSPLEWHFLISQRAVQERRASSLPLPSCSVLGGELRGSECHLWWGGNLEHLTPKQEAAGGRAGPGGSGEGPAGAARGSGLSCPVLARACTWVLLLRPARRRCLEPHQRRTTRQHTARLRKGRLSSWGAGRRKSARTCRAVPGRPRVYIFCPSLVL